MPEDDRDPMEAIADLLQNRAALGRDLTNDLLRERGINATET